MLFRVRKSIRVVAAVGAAGTPSFGVGPLDAAAAATRMQRTPACDTYKPSPYGLGVAAGCAPRVISTDGAQPFSVEIVA